MKWFALPVALVICFSGAFCTQGASPYATYDYSADNYNGMIGSQEEANAGAAPDAFVYSSVLNSTTLENLTIPFNTPEDFCCDENGNIFVADTGNSRLVMINAEHKAVVSVITGWDCDDGTAGELSGITGLYYTGGILYLCLQDSGRIVMLETKNLYEANGVVHALRVITSPDLSAVTDTFSFKPTKLVADSSGRMYAVVQGTYDGLVTLDTDGSFLGYIGANQIQMSLWERFWRSISTTEQIEASADTVPVEFYGIDIDTDGFIYTTSKGESEGNSVRRLNLIGNNVLKTGIHNVKGELSVLNDEGNPGTDSNLVDIDVTEGGIYTCLDNARGHIFTYNNDGDLLFAFGGLSAQKGAFSVPAAVEWCGSQLIVLDKGVNELVVFSPTEYGGAVISAARTQYSGLYGESWHEWSNVLKMNPNNELANRSVGKLEYDKGNYKSAMKCFKLSNDTKLYSKAYTKYRGEVMTGVIPWIAIGIIGLIVIFAVFRFIRYWRKAKIQWQQFKRDVYKRR